MQILTKVSTQPFCNSIMAKITNLHIKDCGSTSSSEKKLEAIVKHCKNARNIYFDKQINLDEVKKILPLGKKFSIHHKNADGQMAKNHVMGLKKNNKRSFQIAK